VVGGNKALGTALLRPLIWLARQMFYVYVQPSATTPELDTPDRLASLRKRGYAMIHLYRVMPGDEETCEAKLARRASIPDE